MHTTTFRNSLVAAAVVALTAAPLAWAQTTAPGSTATPQRPAADAVARSDANFMKQAAQNSHAEIEASRMALQKSAHAEVKKFAQAMIDDHTKANQELMSLAAAKGVELPTEPSLLQRGKAKLMLDMADGETFDRRYVSSMGVEAHEETLELFREAARDARDPDVKAWAGRTVPKLEHHLQMARTLDTSVNSQRSGAVKN